MIKDNLSRQLEFGKYECYPGVEESDEDDLDLLARSFDISIGNLKLLLLNLSTC